MSRAVSHLALAAAGLLVFLALTVTSGRITAGSGLGWDGSGYAAMMAEGLDQGSVRHAWIDGQRVAPMKVNLAFTAVPVPAGSHRIELRYDSGPLWVGAGLSVFTLVVWLAMERRVRRRWIGSAAASSSR